MGHGHVIPNPDGSKARCGGPSLCPVCNKEAASLPVTIPREIAVAADSMLSWIWHRYLSAGQRETAGQAEYDKIIAALRRAYETPRS